MIEDKNSKRLHQWGSEQKRGEGLHLSISAATHTVHVGHAQHGAYIKGASAAKRLKQKAPRDLVILSYLQPVIVLQEIPIRWR